MDKAKHALDLCRATLESQAAMDHPGTSMDPDNSLNGSFANMRLRYLLDSGDWSGEAAGWSLSKTAGAGARFDFAFARVMSEVMQRHGPAAREALVVLTNVAREVVDIQTKRADPDPTYRVRPEIFLLEARGLLAELDGDFTGAEKLLRQAVEQEEKLPIAFGPPTIDKPTHELLGEFLVRRGRKAEAHAEFQQALARTPGRRLAEQGLKSSAESN
jgi:tetratricopeptide (TPR) repeat protein